MGFKTDWHIEIHRGIDLVQASGISHLIDKFSSPDRQRRSHTAEYYYWKLSQNPIGRGVVGLAVNSQNEIVASTTATYKAVWLNNQRKIACEFGDSYTSPNYQRQGIMTMLIQKVTEFVLKDEVEILYTTPNNQSINGYVKKCSFMIKSNFPLYLWAFPLSPLLILSNKYPFFRLFKILDNFYRSIIKLLIIYYKEVEIKPLYFDKTYDQLNKIIAKKYPFFISKESSYLHFRYNNNPDNKLYGLIEIKDSFGELEAALIFKKSSQDGMNVFIVVDMFGLNRRALSNLWVQAIKISINQGFNLIAFWGPKNWKMARIFAPLCPLPISKKNLLFFTSETGMEIISQDSEILFSIGDTDNA